LWRLLLQPISGPRGIECGRRPDGDASLQQAALDFYQAAHPIERTLPEGGAFDLRECGGKFARVLAAVLQGEVFQPPFVAWLRAGCDQAHDVPAHRGILAGPLGGDCRGDTQGINLAGLFQPSDALGRQAFIPCVIGHGAFFQ